MIGHRSRFRKNDDLPPWQGPVVKKNLCAVGMPNAILGNDLKHI